MKKTLIIAPHPDDEILGCGGIMHKLAQSAEDDVYVLIMSRGTPKLYSEDKIENVREEALAAHKTLGVKDTFFLNFHAPEMDAVPLADVSRSIAEVIQRLHIDVIFIPHRGDIHNDHTIVFKAALVAARPVGNYTVKEIYCYETLSETEWAPPFGDDVFIPNYFVNVTEQMPFKLEAMACFKSQLKEFPNPRSLETIEALAKFRGATVGFERAEAFMTMRRINE